MASVEQRIDSFFRQSPESVISYFRGSVAEQLAAAPDGLVLYGAGHYGTVALQALRQTSLVPKAFVDADPRKAGTLFEGLPVVGLSDFLTGTLGKPLVVVTVYNCNRVLESLGVHGVPAITYAQLAVGLGAPLLPYCGISNPVLLWENEDRIRATARLWADEESREEFMRQLEWSLALDPFGLPAPRPAAETYFSPDVISLRAKEVFVDCGGFDGDSLAAFIERCPTYDRAIAIEPDPDNRERMRMRFGGEELMRSKRLSMLPYAVSDRADDVLFNVTGTAGSAVAKRGLRVSAAPLDALLSDVCPTFIKMDIEGAEPLALLGAQATLRRYRPRLAVCAYHDRAHLWEIPALIASIQPEYQLRLRRYANECWELVCYASAADS